MAWCFGDLDTGEGQDAPTVSESAVKRLVGRLLCWWFGCYRHENDPAPPGYAHCVRCDGIVPYSDEVGDTRHNRAKDWCRWYLFRKWWPEKCEHGKRWRCNEEHLPF